MRFLCDENVPSKVARALVDAGHDVVAMGTRDVGAKDQRVLDIAVVEKRVLITYDRDFGELIFRDKLRPAPTTVYVRTVTRSPADDAKRVLEVVAHVEDGYFHVVDGGDLRKRKIDR